MEGSLSETSRASIACDEVALLQEVALLCEIYGDRRVNQTILLPLDRLITHRSPQDEDRSSSVA